MTTTEFTKHLQSKIEALVRVHIAAQHAAATAAVERAFAAASASSWTLPKRGTRSPPKGFRKRPPDEMAAICEKLLASVHACPGETMTAIAEELGLPVAALKRPMLVLRNAGRVRSAGQRNLTRYFPMTATK